CGRSCPIWRRGTNSGSAGAVGCAHAIPAKEKISAATSNKTCLIRFVSPNAGIYKPMVQRKCAHLPFIFDTVYPTPTLRAADFCGTHGTLDLQTLLSRVTTF